MLWFDPRLDQVRPSGASFIKRLLFRITGRLFMEKCKLYFRQFLHPFSNLIGQKVWRNFLGQLPLVSVHVLKRVYYIYQTCLDVLLLENDYLVSNVYVSSGLTNANPSCMSLIRKNVGIWNSVGPVSTGSAAEN